MVRDVHAVSLRSSGYVYFRYRMKVLSSGINKARESILSVVVTRRRFIKVGSSEETEIRRHDSPRGHGGHKEEGGGGGRRGGRESQEVNPRIEKRGEGAASDYSARGYC